MRFSREEYIIHEDGQEDGQECSYKFYRKKQQIR